MKSMLLQQLRVIATFFCMLVFIACATVSPSKVVKNPYVTDGASNDVASVTFIRVDSFFGGGVAIPVYLNAKLAIKMRTETYATLFILPGRYDISTGKDHMKLPGTEPAEAYHGELVFLPANSYFILLYPEQYGVTKDIHGNAFSAYWMKFKIIDNDEANQHLRSYELIPP